MNLLELLTTNSTMPRQENRIYGVVTGIVREIKDPEGLGRVKVDFPWLTEDADAVTMEGGQEVKAYSQWARIATLMAGKGRGTWFIPQVEDEVLVAFEHGYLNRPMIIGSLWNVEDKPPEAMDDQGKNDLRVIHSRSGHRIVLNDSKDKPSILIVDKTGDNSFLIDSAQNAMTIKVKGNLTIDVGGDLSIKVQGKIAVDAGRDITAETKANLKAKATGQGSLESTGPLKVKSGAKLTADGSGQAELKAATVSVSGSNLTEVKGTLVKIN